MPKNRLQSNVASPNTSIVWQSSIGQIALNSLVQDGTLFTAANEKFDRAGNGYEVSVTVLNKAAIVAHGLTITKGTGTSAARILTDIFIRGHVAQVFADGSVAATSTTLFASTVTNWPAGGTITAPTELPPPTSRPDAVMTIMLVSAECFYSKTVKTTPATGSPATGSTGTGDTQSVQAPFAYRTANTIQIVAVDGSH